MSDLALDTYFSVEKFFTVGMSEFQMKNFVINDHITPYRKLKQAVIEARVRLENITSYGFDLEEIIIKHDDAYKRSLNKNLEIKEQRLAEVEIRRLEFERDRKQLLIEQLKSEAKFFLTQIEEIARQNYGGVNALVGKLQSSEFISAGEKEFWTEKLTRGAISDLVNYGTLSKGIFESILCLGSEEALGVISKAIDHHQDYVQESTEIRTRVLTKKDE